MILTEDDLQQVLRRRALQRQKLLPREGDRDRLTPCIAAVFGLLVFGVVTMFMLGW